MSAGEQPAALPVESGWNTDSTDHLIEFAHGLLSAVADQAGRDIPGWADAWSQYTGLYKTWRARGAEETCHKCGRDFIPWAAPSPLWNEVLRGGSINGGPEPYRGIVCPACFMALAEKAGIATGWRVYAATVFRHLETVTPTGRVWNPQTWLYDDPTAVTS